MSKRKSLIDTGLSKQQQLFDTDMSEGELDILLGLKQLMSRQIAASKLDRYDIAAGISRLTLRDCTKDMLDKLTSSDPAYEPGVVRLAAFCRVTGNLDPFRYVLEPLGAEIVNPEDVKFLKLARLEEQRRKLEQEIQHVRAQCGIK